MPEGGRVSRQPYAGLLVLLRHARAADAPGMDDADRPLLPAGESEAVAAGRWLRTSGVLPDIVLCSSALRARQTWDLAAGELQAVPAVTYDERIYDADAPLLSLVRESADDTVRTLLLVGHNPGIHRLAHELTGADELRDGFPAASLAVIGVSGSWAALASDTAELVAFVPPVPR